MILSKEVIDRATGLRNDRAWRELIDSHEELRAQRDEAVGLLRDQEQRWQDCKWGFNLKLRARIQNFLAEV